MPKPFKVVVWGPGGLGRIIIREVVARDDFELVGVFCFSEGKEAVDAGTLAGIAPVGVLASRDSEEVLSIDCDVVLHASQDHGYYKSLDEICQILQAGRDLLTVHPYQVPHVLDRTTAPDDAVERIEAACLAGSSTFHSTGIHPEYVCNRLVGTLSGLSSDITSIEVSENWDASHIHRRQLEPMGFGKLPEQATGIPMVFADNYAIINLHTVADALGVSYSRVESAHEHVGAPEDMPVMANGMTIKKGQVARLTHRHVGYVDDVPHPFTVTVEVNWMLGRGPVRPSHITTDDYYIVTIEGRPAVRLALDIQGSFRDAERHVIPGDPSSEPGYHATVVTLLQNVPRVNAAGAGWLDMVHPVPHWAADVRDSWSSLGVASARQTDSLPG